MQIVPAGVARHLGVIPPGGKQTTAEKRFGDINSLNGNGLIYRLQILSNVLTQQIVELTQGNDHPHTAQRGRKRIELLKIQALLLLRMNDERRGSPTARHRFIEQAKQLVHGDRIALLTPVRPNTCRLRVLAPGLTKLTRRHIVNTPEPIAHHTRAGETLLKRNLVQRSVRQPESVGRLFQPQVGDVLHETDPHLLAKETREPGFRDIFTRGDFRKRNTAGITGIDPLYHPGDAFAVR